MLLSSIQVRMEYDIMNEQKKYPYFLYTTDILSSIKEQFFRQKQRAIDFAEQMIQNIDLSYIPSIFSCFL